MDATASLIVLAKTDLLIRWDFQQIITTEHYKNYCWTRELFF